MIILCPTQLPEVNHAGEEEAKLTGHTWRIFLLQNGGLLLGYGIILLLAFFTERIDFESVWWNSCYELVNAQDQVTRV